jgi:hypothetical protein
VTGSALVGVGAAPLVGRGADVGWSESSLMVIGTEDGVLLGARVAVSPGAAVLVAGAGYAWVVGSAAVGAATSVSSGRVADSMRSRVSLRAGLVVGASFATSSRVASTRETRLEIAGPTVKPPEEAADTAAST